MNGLIGHVFNGCFVGTFGFLESSFRGPRKGKDVVAPTSKRPAFWGFALKRFL